MRKHAQTVTCTVIIIVYIRTHICSVKKTADRNANIKSFAMEHKLRRLLALNQRYVNADRQIKEKQTLYKAALFTHPLVI